ncbi:hypothetical protein GCM10023195_21990 [Actinoallomurus liliacearum]|uniref:Uncharacterized protein n=1 Tax=Actinoallomurus liliacearum TaxID=1080073 RepID=A0ABP8TEE9_9ACTN
MVAKDWKASKAKQQPSGSQKQPASDTRLGLTRARQDGTGETRQKAWRNTGGTHN